MVHAIRTFPNLPIPRNWSNDFTWLVKYVLCKIALLKIAWFKMTGTSNLCVLSMFSVMFCDFHGRLVPNLETV